MGCFAELGWAWNIKPSKSEIGSWKASLPTAEFTESFVIWLYGATNVFLEHLAAWGGAWTAQDLEHVSISIMFFGGGLVSRDKLHLLYTANTSCSAVCSLNRDASETGSVHPYCCFTPATTSILKNRRLSILRPEPTHSPLIPFRLSSFFSSA